MNWLVLDIATLTARVTACFMMIIVMLFGHHRARADEYSCDQVRSYVAQVGAKAALAVARNQGMTPAQEVKARHCFVYSTAVRHVGKRRYR